MIPSDKIILISFAIFFTFYTFHQYIKKKNLFKKTPRKAKSEFYRHAMQYDRAVSNLIKSCSMHSNPNYLLCLESYRRLHGLFIKEAILSSNVNKDSKAIERLNLLIREGFRELAVIQGSVKKQRIASERNTYDNQKPQLESKVISG